MPGGVPELPATEPVDPVAPAVDPAVAMASDGPELPVAKEKTPMVESVDRFSPGTAAARMRDGNCQVISRVQMILYLVYLVGRELESATWRGEF